LSATTAEVAGERLLSTEDLRNLSHPSTVMWLLAVFREGFFVLGAMALCVSLDRLWLWPLAILFIGTRQHALGILVHEGAHFLVSRNRWWNDFLSNWLAAYPLCYSTPGYRTFHLEHHRLLETPKDPERASIDLYPWEWTYPMPRGRLLYLHTRDLLGLSIVPFSSLVRYLWQVPGGALGEVVRVTLYHLGFFALAWLAGHPVAWLVLWYVPLLTVAPTCFRFRTAAEHSALGPPEERYTLASVDVLRTTRTVRPGSLGAFLFAPFSISYHTEHHLFPSVPFFRLPALHRQLMGNPRYASRVKVEDGHLALVRTLTNLRPSREMSHARQ
jgi:fatty acid desaturase